jgi:hypothetical protein
VVPTAAGVAVMQGAPAWLRLEFGGQHWQARLDYGQIDHRTGKNCNSTPSGGHCAY